MPDRSKPTTLGGPLCIMTAHPSGWAKEWREIFRPMQPAPPPYSASDLARAKRISEDFEAIFLRR